VAGSFACGGSRPNAPTSTPSARPSAEKNDGLIRGVADGQLVVAHFSSRDGLKGLVLDRTGGKFKVRIDGEMDVVELTPEEDRYAGELRGHYLVTPGNTRLMYLSAYGGLKLYTGRDEIAVSSDKPADALGPATIAGPPKKEKAAADVYRDKLEAISVRKKMPKMTSADACNLAKVGEAVAGADASMVVRFVAHKDRELNPSWTPYGISGIGFGGGSDRTDEKWDKAKTGLAKYGALVKGYSEYESVGNHLFVQTMKGYPPPLSDKTPGVVWEVDSTSIVFVAFDGGRYVVDAGYYGLDHGEPLVAGAGPASGWPAPLQHSLLGITEVSALSKAGALPQATADDLVAIDDEWNACAQKVWKTAKPEIDRLNTTDMHWGTRAGRGEVLHEKWVENARRGCKASSDKLEKALVQIIEARDKERVSVFDRAKAKFGAAR
jgi:hypothetical protein